MKDQLFRTNSTLRTFINSQLHQIPGLLGADIWHKPSQILDLQASILQHSIIDALENSDLKDYLAERLAYAPVISYKMGLQNELVLPGDPKLLKYKISIKFFGPIVVELAAKAESPVEQLCERELPPKNTWSSYLPAILPVQDQASLRVPRQTAMTRRKRRRPS